jgi:8-oxo-dGTP diphosphatase
MPTKIVAAVIRRGGRILICQRARGLAMPLRWEFPGGKIEPGETERAALRRELREELGIEARPGAPLARIRHRYAETGELELTFFAVDEFTGEIGADFPNAIFEAIAWEPADRLSTYDFLPADRPLIELLMEAPTPL